MNKLLITKGLPGSGKTTWAREYIQKNKAINICKDDLRKMMPKFNEGMVLEMRNYLTEHYIKLGHEVIWSDTNLNPVHEEKANRIVKSVTDDIRNGMLGHITDKSEYPKVEIKDFTDVPLETCIKQDLKRFDSVGKDVIMEMYCKYLLPKKENIFNSDKENCYIFDIDGTIAEVAGRSHFDYSKGAVLTDTPRTPIIEVLSKLWCTDNIVFVSGRKAECQDDTLDWISKHVGFKKANIRLYMREDGDDRDDSIVKKEIYDKYIEPNYNVLGVFDDRPRVLREWRKLGLTTFDVGNGYEF